MKREFDLPCKECGTPCPPAMLPNREGGFTPHAKHCRQCVSKMFTGNDFDEFVETEKREEEAVTAITKTCLTCGNDFRGTRVVIMGRTLNYGTYCEACTEKQKAKKAATTQEKFVAERKAEWETICPDFYRTEEIVKLLNDQPEKKQAITAGLKKGGVLIHGKSGTFKTTAMLQSAVKRLVFDRERVLFISAPEWKQRTTRAAKDCETETFLRPFSNAPWLFLDDFGNMSGTPASEESLLALTENRMRKKLPLLITTQYAGPDLHARFKTSPELADAIIRRIGILCPTVIKFL